MALQSKMGRSSQRCQVVSKNNTSKANGKSNGKSKGTYKCHGKNNIIENGNGNSTRKTLQSKNRTKDQRAAETERRKKRSEVDRAHVAARMALVSKLEAENKELIAQSWRNRGVLERAKEKLAKYGEIAQRAILELEQEEGKTKALMDTNGKLRAMLQRASIQVD
jgi:hypothetical protein